MDPNRGDHLLVLPIAQAPNRGEFLAHDLGLQEYDALSKFKEGDYVLYIPDHLMNAKNDEMILDENLGVVQGKSGQFVFVSYNNRGPGIATNPRNLYLLKNRIDLITRTYMLRFPSVVDAWIEGDSTQIHYVRDEVMRFATIHDFGTMEIAIMNELQKEKRKRSGG